MMKTLSHNDYTVGWICALPSEMAASKAMLDEIHAKLPQPQHDHNTYTLGEVFGHNVAVACLPSGVYGTTSAAMVAAQMLSTFPAMRFGLMVGIGGGVPSRETDIRLGDIVVSKPTGDLGGVVQYDYGKTISDGHFQRTGSLNKPPQVVLTAITDIQANYLMGQGQVPRFLSEMQAKYPSMTRFTYQGQNEDNLFAADYDHPASEMTCQNCDRTQLLSRPDRLGNSPDIHYGLIASGNRVMKHGGTRDLLAKELGILCFEMEAAGLMDSFPCLVIRGICDYSDSHKNKLWQEYAAATAAAYAKEVLSVIPVRHIGETVAANETLSQNISAPVKNSGIDGKEQCLDSLNDPEARERISEVEETFGDTYEWIFASQAGFAKWLCDRNSDQVYWIQGKPGSGKSTAMKFVLRHPITPQLLARCDNRRWVIAGFFFHDRGSKTQKSIEGLLKEILYQILTCCPDLVESIMPVFERVMFRRRRTDGGSGPSWSAAELGEALLTVSKQMSKQVNICLFIDALDEHYGDHRKLLKILNDFSNRQDKASARVKLCLASRPENIFKDALQNYPGLSIHEHTAKDIESYVFGKLEPEFAREHSADNISGLRQLSEAIKEKADGVFIWVKLVVDELTQALCDGDSLDELYLLLESIPSELKGMYTRALLRIKNVRSSDQLTRKIKWESFIMLQIALCCRAPYPLPVFMRVASLLVAEITGDDSYDDLRRQLDTNDAMRRRLASRTGGLLEPVTGSQYHQTGLRDVVQFIHQTAKEFAMQESCMLPLTEDLGPDVENGHVLLLRFCIASVSRGLDLRTPDFIYHAYLAERTTGKSNSQYIDQLAYAESDGFLTPLEDLCMELDLDKSFGRLRIGSKDRKMWLLLMAVYGDLFLYFTEKWSPALLRDGDNAARLLLAATYAGLSDDNAGTPHDTRILKFLLQNGIKVDTTFEDTTPLQVALEGALERIMDPVVEGRRLKIIEILLASGANPNQKMVDRAALNFNPRRDTSIWGRALHYLVRSDQHPDFILTLLNTFLRYGADPNVHDYKGNTPLFYVLELDYSTWSGEPQRPLLLTLLRAGANPRRLNSRHLNAINIVKLAYNGTKFKDFQRKCEEYKDILQHFPVT